MLTCACLPIHSPIPSQRPHASSLPLPCGKGSNSVATQGQCSSRRVFLFCSCSCSGFDSASSMRTELEISVPSRPQILVRPVNKQQACDRACVRIRTVIYPQHVLDNSLAYGISAGQTSWGHDGSLGPRERKKISKWSCGAVRYTVVEDSPSAGPALTGVLLGRRRKGKPGLRLGDP